MKTSLDISCESSAQQTIHMKYQDVFSLKNKNENFRLSSATNFAWHFRVNTCVTSKDSDQPVHPPSVARILVCPFFDRLEAVEGTCDQ